MAVDVRKSPIMGMGQRLLELKELLGYETINSFAEFLLISPTTFHRLTHRNPTDSAYLSTETINRLVQRIKNLNLNWFFTGVGSPFIDHDAQYLKDKVNYYREELLSIQNLLAAMHSDIREDLKEEKFHGKFIEHWEEKLQDMALKRLDGPPPVSLGATQKLLVKQLLDGGWIKETDNSCRLIYNGGSTYIPIRKINPLLKKEVLVKLKLKSYNKYLLNKRIKDKIRKSI